MPNVISAGAHSTLLDLLSRFMGSYFEEK